MQGVTFGTYHSFNDWGLVLSHKEIASPEPKIKQIEVEGGDGVLDYTEFFGDVTYNNREMNFTFAKRIASQAEFLSLFSSVQDAVHGKRLEIVIDDDPTHFYTGRVTVSEWGYEKNIAAITITVDADPYKLEATETTVSRNVSGTASITLVNGRKRVVPTITTTATMTLSWGEYQKTVSAGTFKIPELELKNGNNTVTVTGTGTITFKYRKGGL